MNILRPNTWRHIVCVCYIADPGILGFGMDSKFWEALNIPAIQTTSSAAVPSQPSSSESTSAMSCGPASSGLGSMAVPSSSRGVDGDGDVDMD